jgi:membrane protein DedA with SNARE-associated domain
LHELIQRLLVAYQHSLQTGGYPFIVLLMAMESSVVPLPSEFIIPPAVILVMRGNSSMSLPGIVIAAVIGSWLGASVMYWVSRIAGRPLIIYWTSRIANWPVFTKWPILAKWGGLVLITPAKIEGAERWSERFGGFGILLSRMLPVVRHLIGIPAGIIGMQFWRYSLYTVLGSLFWCSVLCYISFVAGNDEKLMRGELREITIWVAGAALFLGASYYFFVHRMSRKESPAAGAT